MTKKNGTKTSAFGVSQRANHDSSKFYSSRMYKKKAKVVTEFKETPLTDDMVDKIFCSSSENMKELPDNSIHLMVTSPPYNVGKEYDDDLTLKEYLAMLKKVFKETHRVLATGGRVAINVANVGRKPYLPLHSHIISIMHDLGFMMRGEIIWDKAASSGTSFAWGSWKSASNPVLRDVHEYILVFSKDSFSRKKDHRTDTITNQEFMDYTKSIWSFPSASARQIGHPAPFPEELPRRLIQLYTFKGDIILDPFMGSGQTALAAVKAGRHFIGYDIDKKYCELAEQRIKEHNNQPKLQIKAHGAKVTLQTPVIQL
jgi:site-specific DNA-methyltransferase (adenine-specific)